MRLTTSLKAKAREAKGIWRMEHIHLHNLKDITIEFPIGNLVVIAGVAGSGKTFSDGKLLPQYGRGCGVCKPARCRCKSQIHSSDLSGSRR